MWKIYVLVSIDQFSWKVVVVTPLESPNTGAVIDALDIAFENSGKPKHLMSDQGSVFTSAAFKEFLDSNKIKLRYGAVGEHGSIVVTERIIETLKYERLKKIPIIRRYQHLTQLCSESSEWYNSWLPHEFLGSAPPGSVFQDKASPFVLETSKYVPTDLEIKRFKETNTKAYRIKKLPNPLISKVQG